MYLKVVYNKISSRRAARKDGEAIRLVFWWVGGKNDFAPENLPFS